MKDLYLVRRDVLDRIHQNPNAVPIVYPDDFGGILANADLVEVTRATVAAAAAASGALAIGEPALAALAGYDKAALVAAIKARRDLIGFLDQRGYDNQSAESRLAWAVMWQGMREWDNRTWDWPAVAAGTALVHLYCPLVEEREAAVVGRGSVGH